VLIDDAIQASNLPPEVDSQLASTTEAHNQNLPNQNLGLQAGTTLFIPALLRSQDASLLLDVN
jgi:hypothetical protein